jgi:photosystem II stability/assembly factor-like uncharacterized protein
MRLWPRILFVLGAALAVAAIPHQPRKAMPLAEAEAYPSDWFGVQRAFPGEAINQDAYLQALAWARVENAAASFTQSGPSWTEAGPFNIGGRITSMAVAPGGTTLYAGLAAGGVFESTDSGVSWDPVFDQVPSIGAVALDPSDPAVVYVGTGEANAAIDNYDGAGLFRSNDGGQSWSYLGLEETRRIARVVVDPANPSRIFVAAMGAQYHTGPDRGLYRSENGGQTWTKVLFMNDSTGVCDVVFNPAHTETLYCSTWERIRRATYRRTYGPGCGIWRSIDHGTTWTRLQTGLPAPSNSVGRIALAIAASRPSTLYAQIISGTHAGLGLFRTLDAGNTWTQRPAMGFSGSFGGFGWYFGDMAVDPSNPDRVYCMGVSLMRSTDGGVNFLQITGESHVDFHAIWIDPTNPLGRAYVGNDGGFYSTPSFGSATPPWTGTADLPATQFYAGTIDPSDPNRLLGGAQDNGTNMSITSTIWAPIFGGDGFYVVVDPTNPNVMFAESQNMTSGRGPYRSQDGGSFFSQPSGFNLNDRYNWNAPFVMDPSNHNVLLAGSHRVYKSTDNGLSYSLVSNDLTTNGQVGNLVFSTITTLDIAPSNSNYYYAGTDDGRVWRSKNAGGSWQNVSTGLPLRYVTRVTADVSNPEVVYVTLSGYNSDEFAAHVYRSTNAGDTWTAIDGNLTDVPVNDILVDPADANRLYAATDVGVFVTGNLGASWFPLSSGMPVVPVVDLTLHHASRTLVAATHGRSQWKLDLGQVLAAGEPTPPARLSLRGPTPNPSRGEVRFTLEVSHPGSIQATVFDPQGRRIKTVLDRALPAARHTLQWDGRDAAGRPVRAGTYYLRVAGEDGASVTRRLVRLD